jgi:hypothetical protein
MSNTPVTVRNLPILVREQLDELLMHIDEIHREAAKRLEEDIASLELNDPRLHQEMLRHSVQRVEFSQKYAMDLMVSYRNLIANMVDIGHRRR